MPTVTRQPNGRWVFTWPAGTSPYHIWLEGRFLEDVTVESYTASVAEVGEDQPPELEIVEDGDYILNAFLPPYHVIQWRGLVAAAAYLVEQFAGGVYVRKALVTENGRGYYQWRTDPLTDEVEYAYRITPVNLAGSLGTPLVVNQDNVCRIPPAPEVTIEISSGAVRVS